VTETARDPPKVADQVRLLARAFRLIADSPRVCRAHGGLRSRKAGFDSRVGGSAAGRFSSSSGCDGRAHDFAKVEDQVRFLARTWPPGRVGEGRRHEGAGA